MGLELERAYLPDRFKAVAPPPASPTIRPVAILIVAYRNPELLTKCLESVERFMPSSLILLWDNSGRDFPGMSTIAELHPTVLWFTSNINIGFAAAVNALTREVPDHDILLLNPDAVLRSGLEKTLAELRQPRVAAVAPLLSDFNTMRKGSRQWDVAHRTQTLPRALVSWAGYAQQTRGRRWSELYFNQPGDVDGYLTGACLAISRDAWDAVGFFDEEFFLYGEESDWQTRARAAGWSLTLADELGANHTGHGTVANDSLASTRSQDHLRANIALLLELHSGRKQADVFLTGTSLLSRVQRSVRRERRKRQRPNGAKPSVIFTTNRLVFGGAERHHALLAAELSKRGYEVQIVCLQRFGPMIAEIPASVRVVRQPWWAPLLDLNQEPSVLFTDANNTEVGFAALWRSAHQTGRWFVAPHRYPQPDGPTYSRKLASIMRRADGFVALSDAHWQRLATYQTLSRRHFIAPNGVSLANDLTSVPPRRPVAATPHLVMLSRIVDDKNPELLIRALEGLVSLPWHLSIYGDGPDRRRIEAETPIGLAGRVTWHGWTAGPEIALADCDMLCVPSALEAFPLVVLEAMSRRIPVISSESCSIAEILNDGDAGIIVSDISVNGWRQALSDILRNADSWNTIGDKGFERMRQKFTIDMMADAYEAVIAATLE